MMGVIMSGCTHIDAAVRAAEAAREADSRFVHVASDNLETEYSSDFIRTEIEWLKASELFADAVPTTTEGALLKVRAVVEMLSEIPLDGTSLEVRHLHAVASYLQDRGAKNTGGDRRQGQTPADEQARPHRLKEARTTAAHSRPTSRRKAIELDAGRTCAVKVDR
jgi:hypothetical protein